MSEEILINITPQETRVAIVENGVLQEVRIERLRSRGLVGNIYKGRVCRVMPGMDAAFVDIGLEKAAFLHAADISRPPEIVNGEMGERRECERKDDSITEMLHDGQEVCVQVVKDQLGTKGARLTTHVTIPSRYLVLMPNADNVGVSSRIEDERERQRLREIVDRLREEFGSDCGCILRTAAEGASEEALRRDMRFLVTLWEKIEERSREAPLGSEVYTDLELVFRTLRDLVGDEVEKIRIDSRETLTRVETFIGSFVPELKGLVGHYPGERPVFDLYGIEDELQKALQRKVQLKSGGYLIIDQTEAMTTIDVNTGGFIGHRNLEETTFKTNLEATQAIARQLRLRNLGGIIIIDFIDMIQAEHRSQVLRSLDAALQKDHAKTQVCEVSNLGLVEMTRKRTRESLEHVLCETCPTCGGRGSVKTAETVCYELFREILREARQFEVSQLLVLASQEVVDLLLDEESASLAELEAFIGKPIKFQVEALYAQEQFDVVLI